MFDLQSNRNGDVAQRESTCLARRESAVQIRSSPLRAGLTERIEFVIVISALRALVFVGFVL
jgi:hypothetical protein